MKVLIASGGTGGHLYPAAALARELEKRNCEVLLALKANAAASNAIFAKDLKTVQLSSAPFHRRNWYKNFSSLGLNLKGVLEAFKIIKTFRPDRTVGFGGYACVPVVLASYCKGIPVVLHEQNVLPGLANRLAAPFARKVAVSFPEAEGSFPGKSVLTGNPVREEFFHLNRGDSLRQLNLEDHRKTILVFGGSAGAKGINQALFEGLPGMADLKDKTQIIHLTGQPGETEKLKERYKSLGFRALVSDYSQTMNLCYGAADLVIARAGASTVSELIAARKPSILIPYPYATGDHQRINAQVLGRLGCAFILDEGPDLPVQLARSIRDMTNSPEKLEAMKMKFDSFPVQLHGAAKKLADLVLETQ